MNHITAQKDRIEQQNKNEMHSRRRSVNRASSLLTRTVKRLSACIRLELVLGV